MQIGLRLKIQPIGESMYDEIDEVINKKFGAIKGRKAIILLTDGFESSSRITNQEFMKILSESDTDIYPILFSSGSGREISPSQALINHVKPWASTTAGKLYYDNSDLESAFQKIADEMKKNMLSVFIRRTPNQISRLILRSKLVEKMWF